MENLKKEDLKCVNIQEIFCLEEEVWDLVSSEQLFAYFLPPKLKKIQISGL